MANYSKSFNFRNGVQVDNDNFIVNANGLVGIGTTVPENYLLNVYGDVRVTGLVTTSSIKVNNLDVGIATLTTLNVGITSITSGIVSASSGVVTYYGDGSKLLNLPTSQWIDVDPGLGFTSIYAAGNVGIATSVPNFPLQIGGNPLIYSTGIGINSTGDVYSNGIVTAISFTGIGSNLAFLNASNVTSGTLSTSVFPANIQLSGIITASAFVGSGASIAAINADNITSGTLSTTRLPSNVIVSGIITATTFVGNLTGVASSASTLLPTSSVSITAVNSGFTSTGIATVTNSLYVVGFPAKVGVGTTTPPEADIEVNNLGVSSIRVISRSDIATIGIGRSAEIRTGNTNLGFYQYSTPNSLEIINSNSGNVNYYLDYGAAGLGTGAFHWIYGQDPANPRMSLTYNGNLGLGITNPDTKLYVVGSSYISGITTVDNSLTVGTNLTVSNNATISNNATVSNNLNVTGNITFGGSITGNLGITTVSRLGIATNSISGNTYPLFVGGDPVFGPGVAVTATGVRASGNIQSSTLTATTAQLTGVTANRLSVAGVTTAQAFTSGIGVTNPVSISVSGNTLTFSVAGVGAVSLTLS